VRVCAPRAKDHANHGRRHAGLSFDGRAKMVSQPRQLADHANHGSRVHGRLRGVLGFFIWTQRAAGVLPIMARPGLYCSVAGSTPGSMASRPGFGMARRHTALNPKPLLLQTCSSSGSCWAARPRPMSAPLPLLLSALIPARPPHAPAAARQATKSKCRTSQVRANTAQHLARQRAAFQMCAIDTRPVSSQQKLL